MDKIIKVKVEEVVVVSPGDVELATPEIKVEGQNIIATQKQKGGYVAEGEKTTSIPATELDEDLKPENIAKGVSIFGVEGTKEAEAQIKTQTKSVKITKNGTEEVKADEGYGMETVTIETDVKLTLQEKEITTNGAHEADEGFDGLSKVNVNIQPALQEKTATANGPVEADNGFDGLSKVMVDVNPTLQNKAVKIENNGTQTVRADEDNDGLSEVNIEVNVKPVLQEKTATVNGDVEADEGYDGLSKVNINVQPTLQSKTANITTNGTQTITPDEGVDGLEAVEIEVNVQPNLQKKTYRSNGIYKPDNGYDGISEVTIDVDRSLQNKTITENGTHKADGPYWGLGTVTVDVKPKLQDKTVEITENGTHVITQDDGSDGLGTVEVVVNVESSGSADDFMTQWLNKEYAGDISCETHLAYLNDYTFANQTQITSVKLPNITTLGTYCFKTCTNLGYVEIGGATKIPEYCFNSCSSLYELNIGGETTTWSKITTIGAHAFNGASNFAVDLAVPLITTVSQPSIFNNSGIISFTGAKVQSIGTNTFANCPNLTKVDIGKNSWVTSTSTVFINANAFQNSKALTALVIRKTSGAIYELKATSAFTGTPIETGEGFIYVPDALVEQYKAATNWSTYADQILPLSDYVEK